MVQGLGLRAGFRIEGLGLWVVATAPCHISGSLWLFGT